jgi:hypothetical protein
VGAGPGALTQVKPRAKSTPAVTTRTRAQGAYKDKPFDQLGTETMVLRHDGRGWRITHIHWSSRAAPKG